MGRYDHTLMIIDDIIPLFQHKFTSLIVSFQKIDGWMNSLERVIHPTLCLHVPIIKIKKVKIKFSEGYSNL